MVASAIYVETLPGYRAPLNFCTPAAHVPRFVCEFVCGVLCGVVVVWC